MTIGPDNLGNGAAKTEDRFAGHLGYRPRGNRDNGPLPGGSLAAGALGDSVDELGPRNGASAIERIATPLDIANPIASALTQPRLAEPELREPTFREEAYSEEPFREGSLREPSFTVESWLDTTGAVVADHPLLRGLLLELPPKGAPLHAQWLERWFEAARSILELLYRFEPRRE